MYFVINPTANIKKTVVDTCSKTFLHPIWCSGNTFAFHAETWGSIPYIGFKEQARLAQLAVRLTVTLTRLVIKRSLVQAQHRALRMLFKPRLSLYVDKTHNLS